LLEEHRPATVNDLLVAALDLRQEPMSQQFAKWRRDAARTIAERLTVPPKTELELREVAAHLQRRLTSAASGGWTTTFRFVPIPDAWRARLWSWALRQRPGGGHVKLLFELQLADRSFARADRFRALEHQQSVRP
jgi:hypothetical protein